MRRILLGCTALAALSLLLPSTPSYDPWAWLVWGRELSEGHLNTFAGPSWKPLPPLVMSVVAELAGSGAAASLWLVVVRTAGLVALVLAWRIAARLAGGGRWGALAGAIAALAVALSPSYLRYMAHGNEVPLAAALMLGAVLAHLEDRVGLALVLGALTALLRPEAFPFLVLYGAITWPSHPRARPIAVAVAVTVPALWILPEWLGSGDPLGGGRQAASAPSWSLASHPHPWLAMLERAHRMAGVPIELGAAAALVTGFAQRNRTLLGLGAGVLAWTGLIVAMTQVGFSGNGRYLSLALVILCVLAGAGSVLLVRQAPIRWLAPAMAVMAALAASMLIDRAPGLVGQAGDARDLARMHSQLESTVDRVGGPRSLGARGPATVNRAYQTHLAWMLGISMDRVERARGPVTLLQARGPLAGPPARPRWWRSKGMRPVLSTGRWEVLSADDRLRVALAAKEPARSRAYRPRPRTRPESRSARRFGSRMGPLDSRRAIDPR